MHKHHARLIIPITIIFISSLAIPHAGFAEAKTPKALRARNAKLADAEVPVAATAVQVLQQLLVEYNASQASSTAPAVTPSAVADPSAAATTTPTPAATPDPTPVPTVDPVDATTTPDPAPVVPNPVSQAEDLSSVHAQPTFDPQLEKTLNEKLPPSTSNQNVSTTTPVKKPPQTEISATSSLKTKTATTTAATTDRSTDSTGGGATGVPTNAAANATADTGSYYTPLDSLSPNETYALSFIAMLFGIAGTFFIIKSPAESPTWIPQRSPLLEP